MTDDRTAGPRDAVDPTDFDWESPRWREDAARPAADEARRRFRDVPAPHQRGAIDAERSIPKQARPADDPTDAP